MPSEVAVRDGPCDETESVQRDRGRELRGEPVVVRFVDRVDVLVPAEGVHRRVVVVEREVEQRVRYVGLRRHGFHERGDFSSESETRESLPWEERASRLGCWIVHLFN